MKRDKVNLDEEVTYTLRKEKRAFDMFLLSVAGTALIFLIGGFFTYKTFEILTKQDQQIEQLEAKVLMLQSHH